MNLFSFCSLGFYKNNLHVKNVIPDKCLTTAQRRALKPRLMFVYFYLYCYNSLQIALRVEYLLNIDCIFSSEHKSPRKDVTCF